MADIVVRARDLGKEYRIGGRLGSFGSYKTIRESLSHSVLRPAALAKRIFSRAARAESFWALRGVNFDIAAGEVLGIIGRNGAGKSTLLRVLSRITEPTRGELRIRGRVRALLEVGTGFHPELTGRENIFMNGAILGMPRAEIYRRFDEIVAFAEVERFLDTAVKHYSSGMYLRLAFAVAAHLEPEILIIDEVLAVGDAEFQKKCLGKMGEVASGGRTVLFVSHNLPAVQGLCTRGIVIEEGAVVEDCTTAAEAVSRYLLRHRLATSTVWEAKNAVVPLESEGFRVLQVAVRDANGLDRRLFGWGESVFVDIEYRILKPQRYLRVGFQLERENGVILLRSGDIDVLPEVAVGRSEGTFRSTARIPAQLLNAGTHLVSLRVDIPQKRWVFREEAVVGFEVGASPAHGDTYSEALLRLDLEWTHARLV